MFASYGKSLLHFTLTAAKIIHQNRRGHQHSQRTEGVASSCEASGSGRVAQREGLRGMHSGGVEGAAAEGEMRAM